MSLLKYGCHSSTPRAHPWCKEIEDTACGYDFRMVDDRCRDCHRARDETPLDQLAALDNRHTADGIVKDAT